MWIEYYFNPFLQIKNQEIQNKLFIVVLSSNSYGEIFNKVFAIITE